MCAKELNSRDGYVCIHYNRTQSCCFALLKDSKLNYIAADNATAAEVDVRLEQGCS